MKPTPIRIKPMPWTEERIDMLKGLWKDGLSCSQIAAQIGGVTRCAVIGKVHRLGLSGRTVAKRDNGERQRPSGSRIRNRVVSLHLSTGEQTDIRSIANEPKPLTQADGSHIGVLEIGKGQCRWPHGDIRTGDLHFCGHPVHADSPYCAHHTSRAWDRAGTQRASQKAQRSDEEFAKRRRAA